MFGGNRSLLPGHIKRQVFTLPFEFCAWRKPAKKRTFLAWKFGGSKALFSGGRPARLLKLHPKLQAEDGKAAWKNELLAAL